MKAYDANACLRSRSAKIVVTLRLRQQRNRGCTPVRSVATSVRCLAVPIRRREAARRTCELRHGSKRCRPRPQLPQARPGRRRRLPMRTSRCRQRPLWAVQRECAPGVSFSFTLSAWRLGRVGSLAVLRVAPSTLGGLRKGYAVRTSTNESRRRSSRTRQHLLLCRPYRVHRFSPTTPRFRQCRSSPTLSPIVRDTPTRSGASAVGLRFDDADECEESARDDAGQHRKTP